jgi:hypothetical protein
LIDEVAIHPINLASYTPLMATIPPHIESNALSAMQRQQLLPSRHPKATAISLANQNPFRTLPRHSFHDEARIPSHHHTPLHLDNVIPSCPNIRSPAPHPRRHARQNATPRESQNGHGGPEVMHAGGEAFYFSLIFLFQVSPPLRTRTTESVSASNPETSGRPRAGPRRGTPSIS